MYEAAVLLLGTPHLLEKSFGITFPEAKAQEQTPDCSNELSQLETQRRQHIAACEVMGFDMSAHRSFPPFARCMKLPSVPGHCCGRPSGCEYRKPSPRDSQIEILGGSLDHLLLNLTCCATTYQVGDKVNFTLGYGSMLKTFTNPYMEKVI